MHFFDLCLACQNAPNTQTQTFMLWIKNQHWCVHGTCGTSQKWTSASASWMVIVVILFLFFAIVAIHVCHVWLSDLRVKNLKWYLFRSLDEDGNIGRWALGHTTVYRWKDQTFCMLVNHWFFLHTRKGSSLRSHTCHYHVWSMMKYVCFWLFFYFFGQKHLHGRWPTSSCRSHPWRTPGPPASVAELAFVGSRRAWRKDPHEGKRHGMSLSLVSWGL